MDKTVATGIGILVVGILVAIVVVLVIMLKKLAGTTSGTPGDHSSGPTTPTTPTTPTIPTTPTTPPTDQTPTGGPEVPNRPVPLLIDHMGVKYDRKLAVTSPYVAKVTTSSDTSICINDPYKKCISVLEGSKDCDFVYSYSTKYHPNGPYFSKQVCDISQMDECLYYAYDKNGNLVNAKLHVNQRITSIRNDKGEELLDKLVDDVWDGLIDPENFRDALNELEYSVLSPYVTYWDSTNPLVVTQPMMNTEYGYKYYNIPLRILHALLILKEVNFPKPSNIRINLKPENNLG